MRNKRIFILLGLFLSGCYANTSVQLPTPTNSVKPSESVLLNPTSTPTVISTPLISSTPSSSPTDKEIQSSLKNDTKPTPIPSPTAYMCSGSGTIKDSSGNIISSSGYNSTNCWNSDTFKPSSPPYSNNKPIPDNYKDGDSASISLIFKDDYKIRARNHEYMNANSKLKLQYEAQNKDLSIYLPEVLKPDYYQVKELISLSGADTTKLNALLKQYNIITIQSTYSVMSQEQADKQEIRMELNYPNEDFPNNYSQYSLKYKSIDLIKFLTELRSLDIVREANYLDQTITVD